MSKIMDKGMQRMGWERSFHINREHVAEGVRGSVVSN